LTYHNPPLDATEVEARLRAYLDQLVLLAGGPLTVWRVARVVMEGLRLQAGAPAYASMAEPGLSPEAVLEATAQAHGLTLADIRRRQRSRALNAARHHALWELRTRRPDLPLTKLAAWLNRKDHATVIHSLRWFNKAITAGQYATERAHVERALS
jgi:chromosomal replication initiation ATPase DnaA